MYVEYTYLSCVFCFTLKLCPDESCYTVNVRSRFNPYVYLFGKKTIQMYNSKDKNECIPKQNIKDNRSSTFKRNY